LATRASDQPAYSGPGAFLRRTATKFLTQISQYLPDTPFAIHYWDGTHEQYGAGTPLFTLNIKTLAAARAVLRNGGTGFGEAYMEGQIDIDGDLRQLLKLQYAPIFKGGTLSLWEKIRTVFEAFAQRNTLSRVKTNVSYHYDLSYDFYKLWLDKSMTYTCAYFRSPTDTLEDAQNNKHEHICRKLRLEPGMTLVDIGCGWGAMMIYAAKHYGVKATGYTISKEQAKILERRIDEEGLRGQVEVRVQDYREAEGQFDRWVSIGMFEQVGDQYVGTFMKHIKKTLKPGGFGLLHTIGFMRRGLKMAWVTRYIFPGGFLPSLAQIVEPMNNLELSVYDVEDLRLHYGETLDNWDKRFCQNIDAVRNMYGERFVRMWRLYLNGAASGFRYGGVRLYQLAFVNGRNNDLFRTREYLYNPEANVPRFHLPPIDPALRGKK